MTLEQSPETPKVLDGPEATPDVAELDNAPVEAAAAVQESSVADPPADVAGASLASDADPSASQGPVTSPPSSRGPWTSEEWGHAARAFCLTVVLGMALIVSIRFASVGEWMVPLLKKNKFDMDDRMKFMGQMILTGALLAISALGVTTSGKVKAFTAEVWERWAWYLSPLILLPAVPVVLKHEVWFGSHEALLPIILFGALIAEVLFSKSLVNVPPVVTRLVASWNEPEELPAGTAESVVRTQKFLRKHAALLVVVTLALAYGAFMSFYTIRWHNKLGTATFDLGINNNLIYGGLHGKINQSTIIFPEDPQMYLANHIKLGLYTLLPIYALYPKPETLLAAQSISLGLGAIPLFLFARRRLPQWWAAALAIAYLGYYPMHGANFYEMGLVPLSAAVVLCCIWALDAKRWWLAGIFFTWALIMREDIPIPLAMVGAVFLLSGHRPRAGLAMAAIATSWFIFLRFYFMNDVGSWWFPNMYEDLWAAPEKGFRGVVKTLVSNPTYTLNQIFVEKKFWYLMHLLVPLAFLPVRRWYGWAALIPGTIVTLLVTDYAPPTMFSFQYVMHWAPYLFVAAVVVLASIAKSEGGRPKAQAALIAACLSSAALSYNYGAFALRDKALESGYHKITFGFTKEDAKTLADVRKLVASIPVEATVASTERIGAHLSSRVGLYTLRRGSHGVEYIVARKAELRLDRTKETVSKALISGEYGLINRFGEFGVFKKGASTEGNEAIIKEWQLSNAPKKSSRKDSRRNPSLKKGATNESPTNDIDADPDEAAAEDSPSHE